MLNRNNPPEFVQDKSFELLTPEIQKLPSGGVLVYVNGGDQEIIKVELVFNAGKWHEPIRGISHFTSTLLSKGTSKHSSYQITDILDFYGVHLDIHPGFDFTTISIVGLSKNIPLALDLFIDIIANPSFPENELQQALDIYKQGLRINLEKTSFLASREFRKSLFGNAHPYGTDIEINDLEKINQQHLTAFHQSKFKDYSVFVSGKVSDKTKAELIDKLGQLKHQIVKPVNFNPSPSKVLEHQVEKKGATQTSIRIGTLSIGRTHSDYPGLLLLNHILGGFFGSRLMKNIREEKGLTYGIHSSIHILKQDSFWVIGADVNRDNRQLALQEIKNELKQFQNQIMPSKEIEIARNHFIGSLQTEMSTPFAHADKIKLITLNNLPHHYYQQLFDSIFLITEDHLIELANKYYSIEKLSTVTVG